MDNNGMYTSGNNGAYNQGQVYQAPVNNYSNKDEVVTLGEWIIALLVMCVPCVNVVMMFVWAFGSSTKKSKSNFFKAALIMYAIFIVLYLLFWIIFGPAMMTAIQAAMQGSY